jgi:hypothetical protein
MICNWTTVSTIRTVSQQVTPSAVWDFEMRENQDKAALDVAGTPVAIGVAAMDAATTPKSTSWSRADAQV